MRGKDGEVGTPTCNRRILEITVKYEVIDIGTEKNNSAFGDIEKTLADNVQPSMLVVVTDGDVQRD